MHKAEHDDLGARLSRLETASREDLLSLWRLTFEVAPPHKASQTFLVRAVAHKWQVEMHGDLKPATRRALLTIAAHVRKTGQHGRLPEAPRRLKSGNRLIRGWHGETHEVEVTDDGRFLWRGATYRSLSVIATAITGTRRNGPAFFGLRERAKAR